LQQWATGLEMMSDLISNVAAFEYDETSLMNLLRFSFMNEMSVEMKAGCELDLDFCISQSVSVWVVSLQS
jgi:hypothetical protein